MAACSEAGAPSPRPGASSTGGAGGVAGAGGGAGGGGGAGEACSICRASECQSELDACAATTECAPWLSCLNACDSRECTDKCDQEHTEVARVYHGIYACSCDRCGAECTPAQSCEQQCVDDAPLPLLNTAPPTLAETGLFASNTAPLTLASYVRHFVPRYPLWSDGAAKDRYIYIPKCSTIDTSDMDHWNFPIGTRLWKTFTVPVSAGVGKRVETRLLHHYAAGRESWIYAAYQWDESAPDDPALAISRPAGVTNADGTDHDIPSEKECVNCHGKLPERVLGFSAFQLSHAAAGDDVDIQRISNRGWLTAPAPKGFEVPGTPVQQAALGYLHGNCGNCHNSNGQVPPGSPLLLRLLVSQPDYAATDVVTTTVGVATFGEDSPGNSMLRIAPGEPANSSVLVRMSTRGTDLQMPPLVTTSTKVADIDGGIADVTAWVNSLQ